MNWVTRFYYLSRRWLKAGRLFLAIAGPGIVVMIADNDAGGLPAAAVELAVENPLPGTEVEFARRNRDHHLLPHDLTFHMGIGVVLPGSVMAVTRNGLVRREPFEPGVVIGVQPALVVVDEDGCGNCI